jgi:ElaB/YqjD/DUF883 family membrane-anchored ribosome-binding protein
MVNKTMSDSIATVGKDTESLVKEMGSAVADTYHDSSAAARKTGRDLNQLAEAVVSDTKDGVRQVSDLVENESSKVVSYVRESIQERPNLTLGIAAGVGILIGMMLAARR